MARADVVSFRVSGDLRGPRGASVHIEAVDESIGYVRCGLDNRPSHLVLKKTPTLRLIKDLLADRLLFMGSVGRATRLRIGKC